MILILHLGFGKGSNTRGTPVNGLFLSIERTGGDESTQFSNLSCLVGVIDGPVGVVPVSQDPQPYEFLSLDGNVLFGVFPALAPEFGFAEFSFFLPGRFFFLPAAR